MASSTQNRLSEYLPLLAFSAAWSLQLIYFLGYEDRTFFSYNFGVVPLITLAVTSYTLGYFTSKIMPINWRDDWQTHISTAEGARATKILMQLTIVMAACLITANILVPLFQGISLSGAREVALQDWETETLLTRAVAILVNVTIAFSLMAIIDRIDLRGTFPFVLVAMFILLTIAAYSRAHLLLGLSIISVKWISQSKYKMSFILMVFVLFAALFSILSVITSVGSADRGASMADIFTNIEVYAFGGVAGFEFYYATGVPQYQSFLTVPRFVYTLLPGIGVPPPSYFPFIDTLPPINVFSAMYPPFHDFGQIGLAGFFFVYGVLSAVASVAFQKTPSRYRCVLAGFLLYAALMSPFDDQFIRGLTILIIIMVGVSIYSLLFRIVSGRRTMQHES